MTNNMDPVIFPNKDGNKLFGIVHNPVNEKNDNIGIIILSPGIKSRVAPHRLYLKMAKKYCDMGFTVLRFDFYGLGDSEGEVDAHYMADLYGSIQVGRYEEDTKSAMDWMSEKYNLNKFILTGLCGGAITGLFAGSNDDRVVGLLSLGIPVILDSSNVDQFDYRNITDGHLDELKKGYIKKMLDPKSWLRFLAFKSDYKIILKSLWMPVKKIFGNSNSKNQSGEKQIQNNTQIDDKNFNKYFPTAYFDLGKSKKMNLIFSGSDRLYWEFEEKFVNRYKDELDNIKENVKIDIVEEANHIFSFKEWQISMLEKSSQWLEEMYLN